MEAYKKYQLKNDWNAELWIIGDDGEMKLFKKIAKKLEVIEGVKFWGKQFGSDKLNIVSQMDVFFHPSRNEGLPGAVLEAAALGIPCVVSKESNMAEYINNYSAGIGLDINNTDQIYKAMVIMSKSIKKTVKKKYKENSLRMINEEFDWKFIAERHRKSYLLTKNTI